MEEVIEYIPWESKSGYYNVFKHSNGKNYIVIEGLSIEDIHQPGVIEKWTHTHYNQLEVMYWIVFVLTFVYVVSFFVLCPFFKNLYFKFKKD